MPAYLVTGYVCLDIFPEIPRGVALSDMLLPGKLLEIGAAQAATGGAVANTGIALRRLGENVRLAGKVGRDEFGSMVLANFDAIDKNLSESMIIDSTGATSYSLCIQPPDVDRVIWGYSGCNATFCSEDVSDRLIAQSDHLHFGYPPLMRRMYADDAVELFRLFSRAKAAGLTTSLDMTLPDPSSESGSLDWRKILRRVLPLVDIYTPSLEETVYMLDRRRFAETRRLLANGIELGGLAPCEIQAYAEELLEMQTAVVMIKLGKSGAYLATSTERGRLKACGRAGPFDADKWVAKKVFQPCFSVVVRNTTGAGDATIAGLLAAIGRMADPQKALQMAVATGSSLVEATGGARDLPPYEELEKRFIDVDFPCDSAPCFGS